MFLRNALFAMVGVAVLVAVMVSIVDEYQGELTQLQIGVEWALRLIGIAVALAALVELVMLAGAAPHGAPRLAANHTKTPFARWAAIALIGLTIAQANWATALGVGIVVVGLLLAGVIAPSRQDESET